MPPAFVYDLWYRLGAPWDIGPGRELKALLAEDRLPPARDGSLRAADLGCGTGANVELLARHGYRVVGIDQSSEALRRARRRVAPTEVAGRIEFVQANLGDPSLADRVGTFDLLVDYGALNDQSARSRRAFARTVARLARPGGHVLLWGWWAPREALPRLSLRGPSRLVPHLEPGEEVALFGAHFAIEHLADPPPESRAACFLLTRRA
ncbi:MAG: class I SAM-dependent methyltransferase [Candidatus Limnocylindrales bacterium]